MNRFRTGQGPCRANLNKCGLAQSFLWLWPATDHEPRCRHVPVNKIWTWTESTPRSGWWHSHAAEIYSDCSIHKIIINTGCTIKITAPFSCIVAWLETAGVSLHPHAQSSNGTHGHASAPTLDIVGTESIMVPSNFYNWLSVSGEMIHEPLLLSFGCPQIVGCWTDCETDKTLAFCILSLADTTYSGHHCTRGMGGWVQNNIHIYI